MGQFTKASLARLRESVRVTEHLSRGGRKQRHRQASLPEPTWLGMIVEGTTVGESELTPPWYWAQLVWLEAVGEGSPEAKAFGPSTPQYRYEKVYNLCEETCATGGSLPIGTVVDVRTLAEHPTTGVTHYWVNHPP